MKTVQVNPLLIHWMLLMSETLVTIIV